MGDVIVTDTSIPAASNDQILVVRPFNGTPTPNGRLIPESYYSFKNKWYKLLQPAYDYATALVKKYVPLTRTITINGEEKDLSENRSWTVTAAAQDLAETLLEGNTTDGTDLIVSAGDDIIVLDAVINEIAAFGASKEIISLPTATYPDLTELSYVKGVTSDIQTQLNSKKGIATGNNYKFVTTGATGDLQETTVTASRAVVSDANGLPAAATTTATEIGYLNGVTSAVQTQLNSKVYQMNAGPFAALNASTTNYGWVDTVGSLNATESLRQNLVATPSNFSSCFIKVGAQPGTGSLVVTLRKNGVDTALVITVAAGSGAGTYADDGASVDFAAGDLIGWKYTNNASGATGTLFAIACKVTPI